MATEPAAPPGVPTADAAAEKVKKKPGRKSDAEKQAEADAKVELEMQHQFMARIASMMTGAVDGSMSLMDMMWEKELQFDADYHKTEPATFGLTDIEKENVGIGIAMGLQTVSPLWLEKFGFPLMVTAIAASVAVPRLIMCYSLNQIRKEIARVEEEKKNGIDPQQMKKIPDPAKQKPKADVTNRLNGNDVRSPTNRIARKGGR